MAVLAQDFGQILKHINETIYRFWWLDVIWTTLERIKSSLFDTPIISTNKKYLKEIKKNLKINKIRKYKIILEPAKKNTLLQFFQRY